MPQIPPANLYQLRITLMDCHPPCWRTVELLGKTTLDKLHEIIQAVMPWNDSHLHNFSDATPYNRPRRGRPIRTWSDPRLELGNDFLGFPDENADEDETKTRLDEALLKKKDLLYYQYDMGDSWYHVIEVLQIAPPPEDIRQLPRCLAGAGMCPPDDCGGLPGWHNLQETIADPKHPDHEDMLEWLGLEKGEKFDPEAFDLANTDKALSQLRPKPRGKSKRA